MVQKRQFRDCEFCVTQKLDSDCCKPPMSPSLQLVFQSLAFVIYIFQPINGGAPIWNEAKTSLPTPLSTFVAGLYKNNIYLIGGVIDQFGVTPNPNVYQLNLTKSSTTAITNTDLTSLWSDFKESPPGGTCCFDSQHKGALSMYSQGSSYSDHLLFIVPYVSEPSNKPSVLLIFDMARQSLRSPQDYNYLLPDPLSDPCVISTTEYVYVIGGVYYTPPSSVEWKDTFQIYNIENDEWTQGDKLTQPRRNAACNILSDSVYVFGGRGPDGDLDTIERYHLSKQDGWKALKDVTLKKKDAKLRYLFIHKIFSFPFSFFVPSLI